MSDEFDLSSEQPPITRLMNDGQTKKDAQRKESVNKAVLKEDLLLSDDGIESLQTISGLCFNIKSKPKEEAKKHLSKFTGSLKIQKNYKEDLSEQSDGWGIDQDNKMSNFI